MANVRCIILLPRASAVVTFVCRTLNRIQSRIYPTALNSNQNMLVCAPTGAGKTNIAMLAVLHEVGQNMRHGVIQKQDFKVVYVAPMKALAAEVTAAFSRRLAPLGNPLCPINHDICCAIPVLQYCLCPMPTTLCAMSLVTR